MFKARILVVDDEPALSDLVTITLEREGYRVTAVGSGEEALALQVSDFDLVVLDVMLPGADGFDVCRELRRRSAVPIIMLTAKSDTLDKVVGLELGADDYITKPFEARELVARVRAVLRRLEDARRLQKEGADLSDPEPPPADQRLTAGGLTLSPLEHAARLNGDELSLTPKEFALLEALMEQPGRAWTRDQLLERAWGYDYGGDTRTVDIHIQRLRKKIEDDPANPLLIQTVHGVGYRFRGDRP